MKIRRYFVSNSSTSSFICEICGNHAEGMDLCLSDCDMFECENGHTMCTEHAPDIENIEESYDSEECSGEEGCRCRDCSDFPYEVPQECCPICAYQKISYRDAKEFLLKEYKVSEKEVFDKVKEINKRRKKLYDEEYVKEIFERNNLNDDSFIEMIKGRFPSYRDYKAYSRG